MIAARSSSNKHKVLSNFHMSAILQALGLAAFLLVGGRSVEAASRAADLVRAELLAEPAAIRPGEPFTVGIRLTMKEGWHTYWRNPGDSGLATEVKWELPDGLSAGEILWPVPERIPVSHLVNYGYEHEVVLLTRMIPAALTPGRPAQIKADLSYLVCERECIPGEASLSLLMPVASPTEETRPDPADRAIFDAARARLPVASPWQTDIRPEGDKLRLHVAAPGLKPDGIRSAYFFAFDETAITHAAPQTLAMGPGGFTLELTRSNLGNSAPKALGGVLVLEEALESGTSRQGFEVAGPGGAMAARPVSGPAPKLPSITGFGVLQAAILAFLGGLILNLMPCVFPVLSIKVLHLVNHSGQSPSTVRLNGLAYAAGVVGSFLILAGLLLALRAGGAEIGWGFQLQSPAMVAGLAFLLFAMGLSLSGVVEFGASLAGLGGRYSGGSGLPGSFLTGVLATVVATPCTAPFMGAAIGFALAAPAAVALLIFVALGLGLAVPFLVLTLAPGLLSRLPRPGAWMEVLKQLLAFPVYATVAWLLFVLSQEVGPAGLFAALLGLVCVGFAAWTLRLISLRTGPSRNAAQAGAALAALALLAVFLAVDRDRTDGPQPPIGATAAAGWEPFTQARLDVLRQEGRPVFVNMTAAWCITCLVNERTTLSAEAVRGELQARDVVYLKGDWTNQNPEITRLLESHGRSGVPLYVLYPARGEPIVLPQILTQAAILDGLSRLSSGKRADLQIRTERE